MGYNYHILITNVYEIAKKGVCLMLLTLLIFGCLFALGVTMPVFFVFPVEALNSFYGPTVMIPFGIRVVVKIIYFTVLAIALGAQLDRRFDRHCVNYARAFLVAQPVALALMYLL